MRCPAARSGRGGAGPACAARRSSGLRPTRATARRPLELLEGDAALDAPELDEVTLARTLVSRASRALDTRERQIVLLRFFCDCTQAEVASTLGISQAHVSRLLASAMAKMRRRLEVTEASRYAR